MLITRDDGRVLILALDGALARVQAGLFDGTVSVAACVEQAARGQADRLAPMVAGVLRQARIGQASIGQAGIGPESIGLIAVTVGPGSFTGLRAALALAHGLSLAIGAGLVGVTIGEAIAADLADDKGRPLWVATQARRGRVYLESAGVAVGAGLDSLPVADGPVRVAGDAAIAVASRLAARGGDVMLCDARAASLAAIASVGLLRWRGEIAARPAEPLYVDAPEAKLPASGLRPMPVPG